MSDPIFQEANAADFDDSLISTTLATHREDALVKLRARLTALTKAAHDGQPVSLSQVSKLKEKITAFERPVSVGVVDLPVGLDLYQGAPAEPAALSDSVPLCRDISAPAALWQRLFDHQKQALKWLCDLHVAGHGGILADEMGLGKTVEIAALLVSLRASNCMFGPVLVLCPATIVEHWRETLMDWGETNVRVIGEHGKRATVMDVRKREGVLVTNYETMYSLEGLLTSVHWLYVILDEGHKIRNPVSKITLSCKRLRSSHRLLLSGTPIQNNLTEFWSLVDFVNPALLGSLETFEKEIAGPILRAGYVSADANTAELGYQCACQLRDLISPYILRRTKKELKVTLGLPDKEEKLLLCEMTQEQYDCYVHYLDKYTKEIACKKDCFACIRDLRHITNHPAILAGWKQKELTQGGFTGGFALSGKLTVLEELLKTWAVEGHKTAVFSQSKRMLTVCETLVASLRLSYARIDGDMPVSARLPVLRAFNHTQEYRVLLLTTKVGGLGVSLTGASRLVLLDPDWNPMTDIQAKERAMRIGQDKNVAVYRFVTRGTIEEKILHNPEQKKFFSSKDINELFEYPPRPKHRGDVLEEDVPRKAIKTDENLILASLLDSDGVKREDLSQSAFANPSNTIEMKRIEAHAHYLAKKATSSLIQSRPRFLRPQSLPQPTVIRFGTADAQSILMKVKEGQCKKQELREKPVSSEELAVKRLHEFLVERQGRASSAEVVAFVNAKLYGFDAYLVKAVLRAIAKLRDGKWVLRDCLTI